MNAFTNKQIPAKQVVQMEVDQEHEYDERFEFDAPRYYDFEAMVGGTPCDKWFDTAPDGPGCKADKGAGVVSREPFKAIQQEQQQQAASQPPAEVKKGNIVTSWGQAAGRRSTQTALQATSQPGSSAAAAAAAADAEAVAVVKETATASAGDAAAGVAPPPAAASAASAPAPARKSLGVGARRVCSSSSNSIAKDGARSEPPVTRSMSRLGMHLCSPVPEGKPRNVSPPMTRSRKCVTAQKSKTTTARTQPMSMQKLRHVLEPKVTKTVRSTKPLTLPDDFELETTKRLQGRVGTAAAAAAEEQAGKSPFKSLAEKVREFQAKTPVRFKTKPAKPAPSKQRVSITKAQSPLLMTSARVRPARVKGQAELEEEELEQARREQFHAKPLDPRVLTSSGQLGVPKIEKPKPTEPQPFNLRSESRAKARHSHEHPSMEQAAAAAKFKAQPLKKSILDGPTFRPHKESHAATVPKSPLLRTKLRSHTAKADEQPNKDHPRPHSGSKGAAAAAAGSSKHSAGPTQPRPFQLQTEKRGVLHHEELAAKLAAEEARAKRLRRVTARPLPVTVDIPVVPAKPEPKPLTLPDPFELKSIARHEDFEERRRRQLQEEEEAARRAAEFKARPMHTGGPFIVHESEAPLTVPEDPHLATEARAPQRHEFDAHVAEKMRQEEEEKRRMEELKRKQEEEAVRQYRKKLRFSARPVPNFDQPYLAAPSDKPLTNPKTPNFASKKLKKAT